ncbi:hypothetical protein BBJ29_009045 [Phytophthora kernoviae]|uniref:Uncharacterized protein n=1 Tax=Phytophthora kernoviae TaxID=325452 RepID=A0A3F2RIC0_9STRA|nr:hypothetical protein BBJ29_009045 [Phytophthora kernoviae]RLN57640.1 hypothetical protein BBP00_00007404 [Phytophthora kernoviae]
MNSVPSTDENFTTLDEALSFIKLCDDFEEKTLYVNGCALDDLLPLADIDGLLDAVAEKSTSNNFLAEQQLTDEAILPPKKKRFRSAASTSTALHRRKNAEIQLLRERAVELETLLGQLKVPEVGGHQAMEYLRNGESPCVLDALLNVGYTKSLKDQLEGEVESLYRDFHHIFQPHEPSMIYSSVQPKYDEQRKATVVEFVTTTPLDWSMEATHNLMWTYLENSSDRSRKSNTLEKKTNVTLSHRGGTFKFGKLHFLRKFEEKDRVVIIWSDILLLPSKKLQVHALAYSVIARSNAASINTSVMHTMLKLQVDCINGSGEQPSGEIKQTQDIVLGAMTREMRAYWQYEQNRLVGESLRQPPTSTETVSSALV